MAGMSPEKIEQARERTRKMLSQAGIVLTPQESSSIEIADLGLGRLETEGLEIVVCANNERYCAKELVMFPRQTCPEHRHPPVGSDPGKTETFRVRRGIVWLYVEGPPSSSIKATVPELSRAYYTVFHEIELRPATQYTIPPNTKHWFQCGDEGATISEFSSTSRDEFDVFTDPRIVRVQDQRRA
jgi:D-lyxose ketol-isomerase